ncbi:MAG: dihydropteroate synthase [Planctomycetota bacterium]
MTGTIPESATVREWRIGHGRVVKWSVGGDTMVAPCTLMAIINVTPDSFSDGGDHATADRATGHALRCAEQGARIVDVGGESTRPGAARVADAEQMARVLPVIQRLSAQLPSEVAISVDTTRAAVARAAIAAGAAIVNDVSGGTDDPEMLPTVAALGCGVIVMHRLCEPAQDSYSDRYAREPAYADVVQDVLAVLRARCTAAERAGIDATAVAVDPGLGFGKSVAQNIQLMERLHEFAVLAAPIVVSASRKSFLGAVVGERDPKRRDAASVQAAIAMQSRGASVLRVHDVASHAAALRAAKRCYH